MPAPVLAMLAPLPLTFAREVTADPAATLIVCEPLDSATAMLLANTTGCGLAVLVVIFPVIVKVGRLVPVNKYGAVLLEKVRFCSVPLTDPSSMVV